MRRYYIASGILLILPIMDFAVAAPVPVQQKPQADVCVVHTTEDAKTKLGKRGAYELWAQFFDHPESHPFPKPEELPATHPPLPLAARPSSNSLLSGPTDVSTNVEQPVSIPKEPSQVASSSHAPPSLDNEEVNKLWQGLYESLATLPSRGSLPSGPAHGWMDVEKPVPSIPKEPTQVASSSHTPPIPGDDELNKLWPDPYESLAAHPSWGSPPPGPAHGWIDVEQPVPSITNEASQVASPDRAPPSLSDEWPSDEWNRWRDHIEDHLFSEPESLAARPSSSSRPSGPAGVPMDVEQLVPPIHQELLPVSSPDRAPPNLGDEWDEMWRNLIESHSPENPDESSAARPPSSSLPSGPAGGSTDVEQLLPPVHEEPVPVSSQIHALPSLGDEGNTMLIQGHFPDKPEESSAARPPSSSLPSGPAGGSTDVEQLLPPIHEGPVPVSSQVHAPPSLGDEGDKMLIQGHFPEKPEESSAARPPSSPLPSGPARGSTDVEELLPPIHEEPVPVSSQVHAPPSLGDEGNKMFIQGHFPEKPEESAARPSSSSQPSGLAGGSTDVEKPLLSIPDSYELWPNLFGQPGSHLVAKPEELSAARQAWLWKSSGPADRWTGVKRIKRPRPSPDPDKLWPNLFGQPGRYVVAKPEALSAAARLSWNSQKNPAEGWTDVKKQLPSIPEEPEALSAAARLSWNSPKEPAGGWTDVKKQLLPIPEELEPVSSPGHTPPNPGSLTESGYELTNGDAPSGPSVPAPSTMSSADQELMGTHSLPNPGPLTESGPEMIGVPRLNSMSSTNPDDQWMGAGSSSGKRKRP